MRRKQGKEMSWRMSRRAAGSCLIINSANTINVGARRLPGAQEIEMAGSRFILGCAALALLGSTAGAATLAVPAGKNASDAVREQLGGMITDQTITSAGKDFYQAFSAMWHDKPFNERFSVAVRERPSARMGNRIQVEYANQTIFEAVLPAARGNIPAISARAVEIAYQNVSDTEVQRLLFRDQDLAGDEF
jgi:curli production assembly/transport component CsgE